MRFPAQILSFSMMFLISTACAQDVQVLYKFKIGEINRYKETTQNDMSSEMLPDGGQKVFSEMFTTQKTEKINADGSAELIHMIDSVTTTLNGQTYNNPQTAVLIGLPVRITLTPAGKVLSVEPVNDSVDATARQSVDILRKQLTAQISYPPRLVKSNESWDDSIKVSQETQMGSLTTEIRYTTTLAGSDTIANSVVRVMNRAVIISGSIEGGNGSLKGAGKGNTYFSIALGKELKSTLELDQTMDMNTPQGPFSMTMKITTKRELIR